jgi:iron-sulfur cluster insertion protein
MASIIFTKAAAAKTLELIQEEGNFNLKLRAYVTGGGCSGLQYGFSFDEAAAADDTLITQRVPAAQADGGSIEQSVDLIVDPLSFQYLSGAEIDYKQDIEGEQFIIRNPNAKTTCGCGSSFTVEDQETAK